MISIDWLSWVCLRIMHKCGILINNLKKSE
jgi:hypothetical protein